MLGRRLLLVLLAAFALLAGPVVASTLRLIDGHSGQPLSGHLAVFKDATGVLDIAEVAAPEFSGRFASLPGNLGAGYSGAAIWLRFTVERQIGVGGQRLLEVLPPYLDDIRFYAPDAQGGFDVRLQGDRLPFDTRELGYRGFAFALDVPHGETTYYLRLQSKSTLAAVLSVWPSEHHAAAVQREYLLFGVANGLLLAAAILALVVWAYVREPLLGHFALLALLQLANILNLQGFVLEYLIPDSPQWLGTLTGMLVGLASAQVFRFFDRLLDAPRNYPRLARFYRVSIVVCLLTALSAPLGLYGFFAPLLMAFGIVANVCAFWPCLDLWRAGSLSSRIEMAALCFYVCVSTLLLAGLLGLAPISLSMLNINALSTLLYLLLFEFGVLLRIGEANRRRLAAEAEAHQARAQREDQTRFLAMIGHELRTPISIVAAAAQSLQALDSEPDEQRVKRYARIGRAVQRMDGLLQNCLSEERIHSGGWQAQAEYVDVLALTRGVIDELGAQAQVRIVSPGHDAPGGGLAIMGDRLLLRVVVRNLIENARKYSPSGSAIEITVAAQNEGGRAGVSWQICDQGPGIPAALGERVFEKYFRGQESSGTPGFGLGLYLARRIVARHGGCLRLDSTRSAGARFVCWLPCTAPTGKVDTQ